MKTLITLIHISLVTFSFSANQSLGDYIVEYGMATIDGDASDWDNDSGITKWLCQDGYGPNTGLLDRGSDTNIHVAKAVWDCSNLYIMYDVKDTKLNALFGSGDDCDSCYDDALEINIDILHTESQYEHSILVNINGNVVDRGIEGFQSAYSIDGTLNNNTDTDVGYIIEIAISWASMGFTPSDYTTIGIELNVIDIDTDSLTMSNYYRYGWTLQCAVGETRIPLLFGDFQLSGGPPIYPICPSYQPNKIKRQRLNNSEISLSANPNPFKPTTTITYYLPKATPVKLQVFSIHGKLIQTITNTTKPQSKHTAVWDASQHPSGIYYFKLSAGDNVAGRKGVYQK